MSDPKMGLWPSPYSILSQKFYNFGHDGTLSIRNFVLLMVQMLKSRLEPKCLVACVACRLEANKIEKNVIWAFDQEFHVDDEIIRESQF
jgi:hypothetical protein